MVQSPCIPMPANWTKLSQARFTTDSELKWLALQLSARLGDESARQSLLKALLSPEESATRRRQALTELVEMRYAPLGSSLGQLLSDSAMREPATLALSAYDDPSTPSRLLAVYADSNPDEKAAIIGALASRASFAQILLNAVLNQQVAKADVPLTVVRQIQALKNPAINLAIDKIWGTIRSPSNDKQQEKSRWKKQLNSAELAKADLPHGRTVFARTCANCHWLFDAGKRIGPELTGSQRTNLDYVLDNVLDPSAAVARDYQMTQLVLVDGRLVTGIVVEENEQTLTLQSPTERMTLAKDDIEERQRSPLSMMPEGLFKAMSAEEVRDLVGYLASPQQVPLPSAEK